MCNSTVLFDNKKSKALFIMHKTSIYNYPHTYSFTIRETVDVIMRKTVLSTMRKRFVVVERKKLVMNTCNFLRQLYATFLLTAPKRKLFQLRKSIDQM